LSQATLCYMGIQLPKKGHNSPLPQFSAHVYCGETAGWIKIPLCMGVGLRQGDIVLDGDPAPPKRGHSNLSHFHVYCRQTTEYIRIPLGTGDIVLDEDPLPQKSRHSNPHFPAHVYCGACGQTSAWIKMPLSRGMPRPRRLCVRWEPTEST